MNDSPTDLHPRTRWVDVPLSPRRWPFFYGWMVVIATVVGTVASIPGQTMGVGVFTDSLIDALGLSRVQLSTAYMFGTITSSFMLPLAGRWLDRVGTRTAAFTSSVGLGLALLVLSISDWLLGAIGHAWFTAFAVAYVVFLLLRFFGQGVLTMAVRVAIGKWFRRHRGRAAGIAGVFIAFGFNASPLALNHLLETATWRPAALILAGVVGAGVALFLWTFLRDNPEDCGLVPDGAKIADAPTDPQQSTTEYDFSRGDAVRTPAFWVCNAAFATHALVLTAFAFHLASLGGEAGLDRQSAYAVFLPLACLSVGANLIGGWISDQMKLKYLIVVMLLGQAAGSFGVLAFGTNPGWWIVATGYGIAGGLFGMLVSVTWPRYFGRLHLGAISSLNMSAMVFASALGPVLFSFGHWITGDYRAIVGPSAVLPLIVAVAALRITNPQKSRTQDQFRP